MSFILLHNARNSSSCRSAPATARAHVTDINPASETKAGATAMKIT